MENREIIERRTFVGETGTAGFDGYGGWRIGQSYQLRFRHLEDAGVLIEMDHVARADASPHSMSVEQFNKWFVKD